MKSGTDNVNEYFSALIKMAFQKNRTKTMKSLQVNMMRLTWLAWVMNYGDWNMGKSACEDFYNTFLLIGKCTNVDYMILHHLHVYILAVILIVSSFVLMKLH